MKSFWPIGNNVPTNIYFGKGAGHRLEKSLQHAQKSIKIISPYVSPALVSILIEKQREGVDVSLCIPTSTDNTAFLHKDIFRQILNQEIFPNEINIGKRKKQLQISKFFLIMCLLCTLFYLFFPFKDSDKNFFPISAVYVVCLIGFIALYRIYRKLAFSLPIKMFIYTPKFKFKAIKTSHVQPFIHLKLFIIDNDCAFFGSANFTSNGFNHNIESICKITDEEALAKAAACFSDIFSLSNCFELSELGHLSFPENYYF